MARNYYRGHTVRQYVDEITEWELLQRLGGYTREMLEREPASVVRRWQTLLRAEAAASNEQARRRL